MLSVNQIDRRLADRLFTALSEQLARQGARWEIVVIGGAALSALGLVSRTTADVDVVGLSEGAIVRTADPLPDSLRRARDLVARDFGLDDGWLNAQAADIVRLGLPGASPIASKHGATRRALRSISRVATTSSTSNSMRSSTAAPAENMTLTCAPWRPPKRSYWLLAVGP
jgi:hypothetical protein